MANKIVTGDYIVTWVAQHMKRGEGYGPSVGIGLEKDGELVAGVVFNEYNGVNINIHVASNKTKNWLNKEFLWYVFYYAFEQAKVKRITGFIEDENTEAITFDEHLGFKYETRMQDAYVNGDILIYVMRKEDCRWLNIKRSAHE